MHIVHTHIHETADSVNMFFAVGISTNTEQKNSRSLHLLSNVFWWFFVFHFKVPLNSLGIGIFPWNEAEVGIRR